MKLQRIPVFSLLAAAADIKSAQLTEHFRMAHFSPPNFLNIEYLNQLIKIFEVFPWIERTRNEVKCRVDLGPSRFRKTNCFKKVSN